MSLYVDDRLVCRFGWNIQTCTLDGQLHRVTYARCRINLEPVNVENIVSS